MTRLQRPSTRPRKLREDGRCKTQDDIAAHTAKTLVFAAMGSIYGHRSVKTELIRLHKNRCAYCETHVQPAGPGNVDHFRPCGSVKQADGEPAAVPGYFWLAYEWDNLLLACTTCNSSRKRDLFPLRNPSLRARTPGQNDDVAEPLFINPCQEDPREHLRYRGPVAFAVKNSARGRAMRDVFQLNSNPVLLEHRRTYLEQFHAIVVAAEVLGDLPAESLLERMLEGDAMYYAMICDAFREMVASRRVVRLAKLSPL